MTHLRPYQQQALDAFRERIKEGPETRLAIEMATGLGKTVTGAAAAIAFLDEHGISTRVLVLVPTDEITDQWVDNLRFAAQGRYTVGVVKAERDNPTADIVVGSVMTLANPLRRNAITNVGFIIVDEAHHAVAPTYLALLEHYGVLGEAKVPALGLSATLARSDGQALGHVWQDLAFSRGISWAQRKGYLLDIVPWAVKVPDITVSGTDQALDAMLANGIAPETVVSAWLEKVFHPQLDAWRQRVFMSNSTDYRPWVAPSTVLFAPLVKSAQSFADAFTASGITAEVVHGAMPAVERKAVLARYESGATTVICNATVLTEGWDSPRTMAIVWARSITSVPLFIQGVGRGLRPWLSADAPPREVQRCTLLCVTDTSGVMLATVADLSDRPLADVVDGRSLLEMEDEYDLGRALDEQERAAYRGPVHVEAWDPLVQASSKAWKYTKDGAPFLPTAKSGKGYVFVVGRAVYAFMEHPKQRGRFGAKRMGSAPDLSLAMTLAEDIAQDLGGDIGALLADKKRPWRNTVPSWQAVEAAYRAGATQLQVDTILQQRAAGKAGKLSDLTDTLQASRTLAPIVDKIKKATA